MVRAPTLIAFCSPPNPQMVQSATTLLSTFSLVVVGASTALRPSTAHSQRLGLSSRLSVPLLWLMLISWAAPDAEAQALPSPSLDDITCLGGTYPDEISWSLICSDGATLYGGALHNSVLVVALGATCQLDMFDSYGDGWNGAEWTGFGLSFSLAAGLSDWMESFVVLDVGNSAAELHALFATDQVAIVAYLFPGTYRLSTTFVMRNDGKRLTLRSVGAVLDAKGQTRHFLVQDEGVHTYSADLESLHVFISTTHKHVGSLDSCHLEACRLGIMQQASSRHSTAAHVLMRPPGNNQTCRALTQPFTGDHRPAEVLHLVQLPRRLTTTGGLTSTTRVEPPRIQEVSSGSIARAHFVVIRHNTGGPKAWRVGRG